MISPSNCCSPTSTLPRPSFLAPTSPSLSSSAQPDFIQIRRSDVGVEREKNEQDQQHGHGQDDLHLSDGCQIILVSPPPCVLLPNGRRPVVLVFPAASPPRVRQVAPFHTELNTNVTGIG